MAKGDMTKEAIMNSFMELMDEKAFTDITISNITEKCHLNRLTFYYHFQDKYDLLNQIYDLMIMFPFQQGLTIDNWPSHLTEALKTVKSHKKFCKNAMENDNGEFDNHVGAIISKLFEDIIDDFSQDGEMSDHDKKFIANFFSYGVIGTINDWVETGMEGEPEELVGLIAGTLDDGRKLAFEHFIEGKLFTK